MEAVRTCAALLVPNLLPPTIFTNPFVTFSAASAQVVGDVLGKLLTVGITDPGEWTVVCCVPYFISFMASSLFSKLSHAYSWINLTAQTADSNLIVLIVT